MSDLPDIEDALTTIAEGIAFAIVAWALVASAFLL
jgi:hypothetical protein